MLKRFKEIDEKQFLILGFGFIVGVIILSMLQDLAHSQVRDYHFHLSESLLYNSFWLLFAPFVFLQFRLFERIASLSKFVYILLQLILAGVFIVLHLVSFPFIVVGFSDLFFEHSYRFQSVLKYELSEHLYQCVGIYLSVGAFWVFRTSREKTPVKNDSEILKTIIIQKGTERIPVASDSLVCITAESPYVAIHTLDKKFLYSDTLTSLISKLDKNQFIRIHKSTIIHIEKMESYISRKNGDYDVLLKNGMKKRMSRTYVSDFKRRIQ